MTEGTRWVTVPEASRILGVSTETVRRRVKQGKREGDRAADGTHLVEVTAVSPDDGHAPSDDSHATAGDGGRMAAIETESAALRHQVDGLTAEVARLTAD